MSNIICRPFITLRNGRRLFAHEVGKTAFCFEVDEIRPAKPKAEAEPEDDSVPPDESQIH